MDFVNFSTDGSATLVGCHIELDYVDRLLIATLAPIGIVLAACGLVVSRYYLLESGMLSIPITARRRKALHRLFFIPHVPRWMIRRANARHARARRAEEAGTPVVRDAGASAGAGATSGSLAAAAMAAVASGRESGAAASSGRAGVRAPHPGAQGAVIVSDGSDARLATVSRWQALTESDASLSTPTSAAPSSTDADLSQHRLRSESSPQMDGECMKLVRRLFLRMILERSMDICTTIYIFVSFLVFPASPSEARVCARSHTLTAHSQRATRC